MLMIDLIFGCLLIALVFGFIKLVSACEELNKPSIDTKLYWPEEKETDRRALDPRNHKNEGSDDSNVAWNPPQPYHYNNDGGSSGD